MLGRFIRWIVEGDLPRSRVPVEKERDLYRSAIRQAQVTSTETVTVLDESKNCSRRHLRMANEALIIADRAKQHGASES